VYSWAVLVWEMLAGCRAWAALNYGQVISAVAIEGRSLQVAPRGACPAAPPSRGAACSAAATSSVPRPLRAAPCAACCKWPLHPCSAGLR